MALTNGLQLGYGIQPLNPVPVDSWSGPYSGADEATAKAAANAAITSSIRFQSMEVRLVYGGSAYKYWYKNGISNTDLVEFKSGSTLNSVGLTMPPAFAVANSPLTIDGTLAVTALGVSSQYIRGDGQLATLPTFSGGGSSVNYYLNGSIPASVSGYEQLSTTPVLGIGTDYTLSTNGLIAQFLTDVGDPDRILIPAGGWIFEMFFSVAAATPTCKFYVELLKYDGVTFTSIADSSAVPEALSGGSTIDLYTTSLAVPEYTLLVTDRLVIRVYIVDNIPTSSLVTLHTENSHLCEIITTFSVGLSSLNGLTDNTQYLAVGTLGSDFYISSVADTHTFNLPTASSIYRGALSSADWIMFNGKQDALGFTPYDAANPAGYISISALAPYQLISGLGSAAYEDVSYFQTALTNPVTGTGTPNTLPKFTGTSTIGDSNISDSGSLVTITGDSLFNGNITISQPAALRFVQESGIVIPPVGQSTIDAVNQTLTFIATTTGLNYKGFALDASGLTNNSLWYYSMPNANGTLALTTDIHNPVTIGTANGLSLIGQELSLGLSSSSSNGALSSTDWNKFNSAVPAGIPTLGDFVFYNGSNLAYLTFLASAPLSYNAGSGTISISQSTTSTNGYLSSTDWNTFNSKQTALNGTGFVKISGTTISYDNNTYVTSNGTNAISPIPWNIDISGNASTATNAYNADYWSGLDGYELNYGSTYSSDVVNLYGLNDGLGVPTKFDATAVRSFLSLSNAIIGSGLTNYVPKFNGVNSLTNSLIYDNGTYIGIGTTTPATFLNIYTANSNAAKTEMFRMEVKNSANTLLDYFKFTLGATSARGGSIIFGESGGGFPEAGIDFNLNHVQIYQGGAYPIYLRTNNTNRVTVTGTGTVLMNQTTDDLVNKLQLTGNAKITSTSAAVSATLLTLFSGSTFFTGSNDANTGYSLNFDAVGYGSGNFFTRTGGQIQMLKTGSWNRDISGTSYSNLVFSLNNSATNTLIERMRLSYTGNLLLGSIIDDTINKLQVTGTAKITSTLTASSFIRSGGTSSQFLKADGSVDSNTYVITSSLGSAAYLNADTGASASTIAQRTSSGYIYATYLNNTNTDINITAPASLNGENGADGFIRKYSAGAVNTFLGLGTAAYLNASQSATANTVVQRSVNGDITGRYINAVGNSASPSTSALLSILGHTSGGDTNFYDFTAGAVQSFLGIPAGGDTLQSVTDRGSYTTNMITVGRNGGDIEFTLDDQGSSTASIYIPDGSNRLGLKVNNSEKVSVFNNGNVGIGTTSPTYKTTISGNPRNTDVLCVVSDQINGDSAQSYVGISLQDQNANGTGNASAIRSYSNLYAQWGSTLTFSTTGDGGNGVLERMRINQLGNVGIGTISPSSRLDVAGSQSVAKFGSSGTGTDNFIKFQGNSNAFDMGVTTSGFWGVADAGVAYRLIVTQLGNVGIGTTSPYSKLEIVGSATDYPNSPSIVFTDSTGTINSRRWLIGNVATDYGSLNFAVSTTNSDAPTNSKMTITKSGNVGIGTTSPTEKLDVRGVIRVANSGVNDSGILAFGNFSGGGGYYDNGIFRSALNNIASSGNKLHIASYEALVFTTSAAAFGSQAIRMYINGTDGNVGIGTTSPTTKLDVNGSVSGSYFNVQGGTAPGYQLTPSLGNSYVVGTNSTINGFGVYNINSLTWRLVVKDTTGNVGIGTTNPSYPLHVATQVSNISIYADYDIVAYSDQSVKENIRPIDNALNRVVKSRGVLYDRIDSGSKNNIGFIAQELEIEFPELVVENPDGTKAVKYQNAIAVLFEAIKEQQKQIEELKLLIG